MVFDFPRQAAKLWTMSNGRVGPGNITGQYGECHIKEIKRLSANTQPVHRWVSILVKEHLQKTHLPEKYDIHPTGALFESAAAYLEDSAQDIGTGAWNHDELESGGHL